MRKILESQLETKIAAFLFIFFSSVYFLINIKFMTYLSNSYEELLYLSPFNYSIFSLNLFNFDPAMHGEGVSLMHPFFNFLSKGLIFIFSTFHIDSVLTKNIFLLVIQTIINALNVVFVFFIFRSLKVHLLTSVILTFLFGISAYSIVTSLVPDSYVYAQFFIILSLYFLFRNPIIKNKGAKVMLGVLNFGITSTNVIPYLFGLFIKIWDRAQIKVSIQRIMKYGVAIVGSIIAVSVVQYFLFDSYWFINISDYFARGGSTYKYEFSLKEHWYSFYLLFVNPIIMPNIELIDYFTMAFVSKWYSDGSMIVYIIPIILIVLFALGCLMSIKKKEFWILIGYVGFAIVLHLGAGFGLATIQYDLFLYAGHYIAPLIILLGLFTTSVKQSYMKYLNSMLLVSVLIVSVTNVVKYNHFYDYMKASYQKVTSDYTDLDSNFDWEFFFNGEGFKVVRVDLEVGDQTFLLFNGPLRLTNHNVDYFNGKDLADIYIDGYLYLTIGNEDSGWDETYVPSEEEIKKYFDINDYKIVY